MKTHRSYSLLVALAMLWRRGGAERLDVVLAPSVAAFAQLGFSGTLIATIRASASPAGTVIVAAREAPDWPTLRELGTVR